MSPSLFPKEYLLRIICEVGKLVLHGLPLPSNMRPEVFLMGQTARRMVCQLKLHSLEKNTNARGLFAHDLCRPRGSEAFCRLVSCVSSLCSSPCRQLGGQPLHLS